MCLLTDDFIGLPHPQKSLQCWVIEHLVNRLNIKDSSYSVQEEKYAHISWPGLYVEVVNCSTYGDIQVTSMDSGYGYIK